MKAMKERAQFLPVDHFLLFSAQSRSPSASFTSDAACLMTSSMFCFWLTMLLGAIPEKRDPAVSEAPLALRAWCFSSFFLRFSTSATLASRAANSSLKALT